jgi:hypothetical protein
MATRIQKLHAVYTLCQGLYAHSNTMLLEDLRLWLNQQGFRSEPPWSNPYWTARGAAAVARATYFYVRNELGLGDAGAKCVAMAFTDQRGKYPWDK